MGRSLWATAALLAAVLASGCATVDMASPDQDSAAKSFSVQPGTANIYIYRNETYGAAIKMPVALDGRLLGDTASKTYFVVRVAPGQHTVISKTENDSSVTLNAVAGRNYFLWQEVKMGMFAARSNLQQVDETTGKAGVAECKLIQSSYVSDVPASTEPAQGAERGEAPASGGPVNLEDLKGLMK